MQCGTDEMEVKGGGVKDHVGDRQKAGERWRQQQRWW